MLLTCYLPITYMSPRKACIICKKFPNGLMPVVAAGLRLWLSTFVYGSGGSISICGIRFRGCGSHLANITAAKQWLLLPQSPSFSFISYSAFSHTPLHAFGRHHIQGHRLDPEEGISGWIWVSYAHCSQAKGLQMQLSSRFRLTISCWTRRRVTWEFDAKAV